MITLTPTASSRGEPSPNPSESRSSVSWKKHERCVWCPRNLQPQCSLAAPDLQPDVDPGEIGRVAVEDQAVVGEPVTLARSQDDPYDWMRGEAAQESPREVARGCRGGFGRFRGGEPFPDRGRPEVQDDQPGRFVAQVDPTERRGPESGRSRSRPASRASPAAASICVEGCPA